MRTLLATLLGFALFGAIFAAVYYAPVEEEQIETNPKFRIEPGEVKQDRLWEAAGGENVTVNITVEKGGPIGVYIFRIDDIVDSVFNGTINDVDLIGSARYVDDHTNLTVTLHHNFTMFAPGTREFVLLYVSNVERPEEYENLTAQEKEPYLTEVAVEIRYFESETKSLILGYIFATPSVLLVGVAFWQKWKKRGGPPDPKNRPVYPRDKDL